MTIEMFAKLGFEALTSRLSQLEAKEEKRRDEEVAAKIASAEKATQDAIEASKGAGGTGFILGVYGACLVGVVAYALYDKKQGPASTTTTVTGTVSRANAPTPSEAGSNKVALALDSTVKIIGAYKERMAIADKRIAEIENHMGEALATIANNAAELSTHVYEMKRRIDQLEEEKPLQAPKGKA